MECKYCKNVYTNEYTLKNHQQNTKRCIVLQKELGNDVKEKVFKCSFCDKILCSKARVDQHYSICKIKRKEDSEKHLQVAIHSETNKRIKEKEQELTMKELIIKEKEEIIKEQERIIVEQSRMIKELQVRLLQDELIKKKSKNDSDQKETSLLKTHRYIKFNEKQPCFYIIESGIPCDCKQNVSRKKFGISGKGRDSIDERLMHHRTNWPTLKVNYIIFMKEAETIEKGIKRIYEKEINPNGHEIIEGVSTEQLIESVNEMIKVLGITEYRVVEESKLKEYNDYVTSTIKVK